MNNIVFVTYASSFFKKNIFWNKFFVKLFIRPKKSIFYTDVDLKNTTLYSKNKEIFDAKIGGGYWAWKPWVILNAMKDSDIGDIVIYQDCGKGLKYKNFRKPKYLISYALENGAMPGVSVPHYGMNKQWTHPLCFKEMNCENEKYYNSPQVEASISVWKNSYESQKFVKGWLRFCLNKDVVGDYYCEDRKKILSHRYDQSVLTNLVIKNSMSPVELSYSDIYLSNQ